jgi:hypothetical protein
MCWHPPCKDGCLMEHPKMSPEEAAQAMHDAPSYYNPGPPAFTIHIHNDGLVPLVESILSIHQKLSKIMSTQQEIADGLAALTSQVAKIGEESKVTLQKVIDLEAALANQDNVSPALQSAFDALKAQVTVVDDLIPDAPTA